MTGERPLAAFEPMPLAADVRACLQDWLAKLTHEEARSPHTISAYARDMRQFLRFLADHRGEELALNGLLDVPLQEVRAFMAARRAAGIEGRSLLRSLSGLRHFFGFLKQEGHEVSDVLSLLNTPPAKKTLPRPVNLDDVLGLIELALTTPRTPWVGLRDSALLTLLYGAGLRISEALALTRRDWPEAAAQGLRVTGKGGKMRDVPLLAMTHRAINDYLDAAPFDFEQDMPLFRGTRGGGYSARQAQAMLAGYRRQLNLPKSVTPHALRHSFATHLLAGGGDLRTIQELLGHAKLSSTQIYTEIDAQNLMDVYDKAHPRAKS